MNDKDFQKIIDAMGIDEKIGQMNQYRLPP